MFIICTIIWHYYIANGIIKDPNDEQIYASKSGLTSMNLLNVASEANAVNYLEGFIQWLTSALHKVETEELSDSDLKLSYINDLKYEDYCNIVILMNWKQEYLKLSGEISKLPKIYMMIFTWKLWIKNTRDTFLEIGQVWENCLSQTIWKMLDEY